LFRSKNQGLVDRAVGVLSDEKPMTLRQLFYRLVSAAILQNTPKEYKRLGAVMTTLREAGEVPRTWIVDHVRATLKPSSWTGLADFGDTVREAYRKDFWASLGHHVEILVEKDAIAGTIQPVTAEFDIALRVVRGYSSVSFAGEIADEWLRIEKPIYAYYLGDFDPSGFDLERDLQGKLTRYSGRVAYWNRLAVQQTDFSEHDLVRLPVKHSDRRARGFVERHGSDCAEVDALPPNELRRRVREAIISHIDQVRWSKLQEVEQAERETLAKVMERWGKAI
jgi:hypothetical protein